MDLDEIATALDGMVARLPEKDNVALDAQLHREAKEMAGRFRRLVGHIGGGFDSANALAALESAESLLLLIGDPKDPGSRARRARHDLKRAAAAIRRPGPRTGRGLER